MYELENRRSLVDLGCVSYVFDGNFEGLRKHCWTLQTCISITPFFPENSFGSNDGTKNFET